MVIKSSAIAIIVDQMGLTSLGRLDHMRSMTKESRSSAVTMKHTMVTEDILSRDNCWRQRKTRRTNTNWMESLMMAWMGMS